jgi:hypothetical protein
VKDVTKHTKLWTVTPYLQNKASTGLDGNDMALPFMIAAALFEYSQFSTSTKSVRCKRISRVDRVGCAPCLPGVYHQKVASGYSVEDSRTDKYGLVMPARGLKGNHENRRPCAEMDFVFAL